MTYPSQYFAYVVSTNFGPTKTCEILPLDSPGISVILTLPATTWLGASPDTRTWKSQMACWKIHENPPFVDDFAI